MRPRIDPSLTALRRNQPCQHLGLRLLNLQNSEKILLLFKALVCITWLQQPWHTNTTPLLPLLGTALLIFPSVPCTQCLLPHTSMSFLNSRQYASGPAAPCAGFTDGPDLSHPNRHVKSYSYSIFHPHLIMFPTPSLKCFLPLASTTQN